MYLNNVNISFTSRKFPWKKETDYDTLLGLKPDP